MFQRLLSQSLSVHGLGLTETLWVRSGDGVRVTSDFVSQVKPTNQFLCWNFKLGSTSTKAVMVSLRTVEWIFTQLGGRMDDRLLISFV